MTFIFIKLSYAFNLLKLFLETTSASDIMARLASNFGNLLGFGLGSHK